MNKLTINLIIIILVIYILYKNNNNSNKMINHSCGFKPKDMQNYSSLEYFDTKPQCKNKPNCKSLLNNIKKKYIEQNNNISKANISLLNNDKNFNCDLKYELINDNGELEEYHDTVFLDSKITKNVCDKYNVNDIQNRKLNTINNTQIIHKLSNKCLDSNGSSVYYKDCDEENPFQKWSFYHKNYIFDKDGNIDQNSGNYVIQHDKSKKVLVSRGSDLGINNYYKNPSNTFYNNQLWDVFYKNNSNEPDGKNTAIAKTALVKKDDKTYAYCLDGNGDTAYINPCEDIDKNPYKQFMVDDNLIKKEIKNDDNDDKKSLYSEYDKKRIDL